MCPVVLLAMILGFLMFLLELTAAITVKFMPNRVDKLKVGDEKNVSFSLVDLKIEERSHYQVLVGDPFVADVKNSVFNQTEIRGSGTNSEMYNGSFILTGKFLGHTYVRIKAISKSEFSDDVSEQLKISVIRKESMLSKVFIVSVATLVSLNYINMGCAIDMNIILAVLKKPVAPVIGFSCQYVFMPLIAYGVGKLVFDSPILQLGLFIFGCSPGGGASNMWTVLLNGNLDLSITMTFISTLASLGMMPLWIFTLGKTLFDGTTRIPFTNIFISLVSMVIPLGIGLMIQRFLPKAAKLGRRILAPACILMIIYIVAFGTYANLYMFKLFSWRVVIAALINVWFGFLVGALAARLIGRPVEDIIAIAVETGVQNTGISIVLLGFSLPQPDADLASVAPVAASIMMPVPLVIIYITQKIRVCCRNKRKDAVPENVTKEEKSPTTTDSTIVTNEHM